MQKIAILTIPLIPWAFYFIDYLCLRKNYFVLAFTQYFLTANEAMTRFAHPLENLCFKLAPE